MMVTGDCHHTAIAVARGVGMLSQGGQVVIIQAKAEKQILPRNPSHLPSALKTSKILSPNAHSASRTVSFAQKAASPSASFSEQASPMEAAQQRENVQMTQRCCEGLTFRLDSGDDFEDWSPLHALTNIAQVGDRATSVHISIPTLQGSIGCLARCCLCCGDPCSAVIVPCSAAFAVLHCIALCFLRWPAPCVAVLSFMMNL